MPKRYSEEQKQQAIQRLIANGGDVARTALETGLAESTLRLWRREYNVPLPLLMLRRQQQQQQNASSNDSMLSSVSALVPELADLQQRMLQEAYHLVESIEEAIDDAPLAQRVAALAQLIDRIIKLAAQLPSEEEDDDSDDKPFEIDYDVEEGDDEEDKENQEETERASTEAASQSEENPPQ